MYDWRQTASDPFSGDIVYDLESYNSKLHAAVEGGQDRVYASTNGATWTAVSQVGMGDPAGDVSGARSFAEFNSQLYVGTCTDSAGAQVWRTQAVGSPIYSDWAMVNTRGFNNDAGNRCVLNLEEFGGFLYAATENAAGAEIWRTSDGTTWSAVAATGTGALHNNGFGDGNNDFIYSLASFDGYLYAGTLYNAVSGTQVFRTSDGTNWTQVNNDGYGNPDNIDTHVLIPFGSYLYAGILNSNGGQLRRTSNGTSWPLIDVGFGDVTNTEITSGVEYRDELFLGTTNVTTGTEMWKSGDGAIWEQVNADGFSSANNTITYAMESLGDTLYVGVRNTAIGSDIRAETPSVTSSVSGAQSTNGDGRVTVQFTIDDAEDADEVEARVEYNVGSGWQKATLSATGSDTSSNIPGNDPEVDNSEYYQVGVGGAFIDTSSGANTITTIWNSQTDEPTADTSSARVRVVADDNISEGDYAQSAVFDLDNVVPTVSANPAGGTYTSAQSVTISANESPVSIYYTDDGSTPTTADTYSSAISVSALGTTVLKFFAVDDKGNQSSVATETYIITSAPAGITLTKTATSSVAPAKVASSDSQQVAAASSLLGEAGGLLAGSMGGQYRNLKLKLIKANLLLLVVSLVLALLILRLPGLKKIPARLTIPRLILFILLALGLSSLASLSVLTNASQTNAAATDVNPGNYISYRLDYSNTGGDDAYGVVILDTIPTYTTYVAGTLDLNGKLKTDAADTDTADYNATNKGKATFQIGTVTVGSSGYVNFKVRVNNNAPGGVVITNQGNGAFNPGNVAFQSNTVQNTVVATGLISGFVFYDANNNGTRDGGDFGISGASVKLYDDVDNNGALDTSIDTLVHTRSSASNGSYNFTGLSAGYYLIQVDNLNTSYKLTTGNMPGQAVLATSTQQYTGADFGYYSEPQLPVTPPIVGGKTDDGSDSSTDTVISRLPVDRVSDYIDSLLSDKTDEEEQEKVKRPDKLEETDDLKRPKEEDVKIRTLIVKEIVSWWEKLKNTNKNYIAPFLFLVALLNFLLGVPLSILLSYLHYLLQVFTEPLLFFSKKKRQGWGTVYDSLTKQPLDLALVRLFDQKTNKLVETRVTDVNGRFLFIVEPEKSYYLTVDKPYYTFPSRYLEGKKADANYHDLYYGSLISANSDQELKETGHIAVNVPLDPQEGYVFNQTYPRRPIKTPIRNLRDTATLPAQQIEREDQRILHSAWWRKANQIAAYIGPVLGLVSFIVSPTWLTFAFLLLHIILLILFNRLALGRSAKPWGKVFNVANKGSLSRSVVRLFDSKYGKLLLTTVSKSDGRYGFLVGQETYSLVPFKEGYKFPPQKAEIIGAKEQVVRKDLGMEKE